MQKMIFLLVIATGLRVTASAQLKLNYTFHVTLDITKFKKKPQVIVLHYKGQKARKTDSVQVKGNIVHFKGAMNEPIKPADLTFLPGTGFNNLGFYLQAGNMSITTSETIGNAVIKGPYQQELEQLFKAELTMNSAFRISLSEEEKNVSSKDEAQYLLTMAKTYVADCQMLEQVYKPYVIAHATSPLAVFALEKYAGDSMVHLRAEALSTIDSLYHLLVPALQQTPTAQAVKKRIDNSNRVAIGHAAPDFTQPDTAGRMVSLSSFRGRYVLIDFWASWCHWCRAQNPNLIKAFTAYHDKKFDILGVSLDGQHYKDAWKKAIHKDQTGIWTQVCEFSDNSETNSAGKLYAIRAIPQNFLIDPNGKIIAVNLEGDALNAKLKEIFE